jgi:hypothetical protein
VPITDAVWSTRFSRSGRRSIRAASTLCTVAGRLTSSAGLTRRWAPLAPATTPVSISDWTISSMKKGLPPVRSWMSSRRGGATDHCRGGRRRAH